MHAFPSTAFSNSTLPAQASRIKPYRQPSHWAKYEYIVERLSKCATCKTDEVCFTKLLWQNNRRRNGFISRMFYSELDKIMVNKVTFVGFRGEIAPPGSAASRDYEALPNKVCGFWWTSLSEQGRYPSLFRERPGCTANAEVEWQLFKAAVIFSLRDLTTKCYWNRPL